MNDIDSMITALYQKEQGAPDLEKTAAENFLAQLQTDGQVAEERPYADLSTAELRPSRCSVVRLWHTPASTSSTSSRRP
jgi:hypothetical protein